MKLSITVLTALLVLLQYKLWLSPHGVLQTWNLYQEVEAQKQENTVLIARNAALEAEVDDLKNGHEAIEERARSELGMVKRNEVFYHIIDGE